MAAFVPTAYWSHCRCKHCCSPVLLVTLGGHTASTHTQGPHLTHDRTHATRHNLLEAASGLTDVTAVVQTQKAAGADGHFPKLTVTAGAPVQLKPTYLIPSMLHMRASQQATLGQKPVTVFCHPLLQLLSPPTPPETSIDIRHSRTWTLLTN